MTHRKIIGRKKELALLNEIFHSKEAEFLAIYGRRRVGKTFLIREFFSNKGIYLEVTGQKEGSLQEQLKNFSLHLIKIFSKEDVSFNTPKTWKEAFERLTQLLEKQSKKKKYIIFLDELPWLASPKSNLLNALDYYWNRHWSGFHNLILIACGSAASWILDNLINAKGGLYNRLTQIIHLAPFSIHCTNEYLLSRRINLNIKQLCEIYMAIGGIPYYLKQIIKGKSSIQNINRICFQKDGVLFSEFDRLFDSLFSYPEYLIEITKSIAAKRDGISREQLIHEMDISSGGRLNKHLAQLEAAGFIQSFVPYGNKKKQQYYRIIDEYVLFYLHWIHPIKNRGIFPTASYWKTKLKTPAGTAWAGLAFEALCLKHIDLIHSALDLEGIHCEIGTWRYVPKKGKIEDGAQVDLLFDREDGMITLCEIKFSHKIFTVDKEYARKLMKKIDVFEKHFTTRKQIGLALITLFGSRSSIWASDLIDYEISFADIL